MDDLEADENRIAGATRLKEQPTWRSRRTSLFRGRQGRLVVLRGRVSWPLWPPGKKASKGAWRTTRLNLSDIQPGADGVAHPWYHHAPARPIQRHTTPWEGYGLETEFHATKDLQAIRDRVFALLAAHPFRLDITLLEKVKAKPSIRTTKPRFYQYAWFLHWKYVAPQVINSDDEVLVVSASVGTKNERAAFRAAVLDVAQQFTPTAHLQVAAWTAASDPCLQVADYCARGQCLYWERADDRSYVLIKDRIHSEFAPFAIGTVDYY